jgi:DNA invertase Pin-like site-specific DNA recombinase
MDEGHVVNRTGALLYVRTNRNEPAHLQLQTLRHLAITRGFAVAGEFIDFDGMGKRPEFQRLLADLRKGGGGVVIVASLSRLFTGLREAASVLRDLLARDYDVIATGDGIDTTMRRDIDSFIAALADLDRETRREKIRAALAEAKRQGRAVGRKRVEVPVAKARELLREGKSLRETARTLRVSVSTLHRALREADAQVHVTFASETVAEAA